MMARDQQLRKLSGQIGVDSSTMQKAMTVALPALLGGLASMLDQERTQIK